MAFNKLIGLEGIDDTRTVKHRVAVRGIIIHNNKILLVHSNLGDYKFPGGGVEEGETYEEALVREIAEETGYPNATVGEKAGVVIQRHVDIYDENAIFEMDSHYYFCEVNGEKSEQQLDGYEVEQGYTPKWVSIEEAINRNEAIIKQSPQNRWIYRENYVLKELISASTTNVRTKGSDPTTRIVHE